MLWAWGTILSWVATGVFASSEGKTTNWVLAQILPYLLGEIPEATTPTKGWRCLINCTRGSKIWLNNAVVATLTKRINGKSFTAEPGERLVHNTVRKQADIEIIKHSDISKPFRVDVTIVQQESDLKSAPRVNIGQIWQHWLLQGFRREIFLLTSCLSERHQP